jgi:hypothetical protein
MPDPRDRSHGESQTKQRDVITTYIHRHIHTHIQTCIFTHMPDPQDRSQEEATISQTQIQATPCVLNSDSINNASVC